jgi:outer membrane protein TolC
MRASDDFALVSSHAHTALQLRCESPVSRTLFFTPVRPLIIPLMCVALSATALAQDRQGTASDAAAPILSVDEAVSLALSENRLVKDSVLEAEKFEFRVNAVRTKRMPQFQFGVLAGQLLHAVDFSFPAGSFGTYAETGPIPSSDSTIRTPSQFTTSITGSIDFPLIQQYEIGLAIRATELGSTIAHEGVRAQRQKIAADVRSAYFNLVAAQTAVDAGREAVKTLEEAQRVTTQYRVQQVVLRADALEVDARLARSRYELSVAENGLVTQRERLNELLGRDLATPFRVHAMPELAATSLSVEAARQFAAENRPEIRQAALKEQQADFERRLAKADYLPDLSVSLRYLGFNNYEVIPANVTTAGLFLTWEPFDWGRRRSNVAIKEKEVIQARNSAEETRAQIAVEVGAKYRKWQEAALLLTAVRTGHEAAVEQFRVTTNRYKEQAALIRDLLQAEARSTEADFQYQQALAGFWSALADLRRAMGDE